MALNPRQLEAFRLVMLRNSVTMAARDLRVTQPAVSRLIRELEAQTGLVLFDRVGNQLLATPEAALLLEEVEKYAVGLRAIESFASDLRSRQTGLLNIAALPAMAFGFLPRFIAEFTRQRPSAKIFLNGMASHLVIDAVLSGQVEVGIASVPRDRPGLRTVVVETASVLLVPNRHRLAGNRTARPQDLAGERIIALAEPNTVSRILSDLLAGITEQPVVTTPLNSIACSLVAAGAGIALVDPFSAADYLDRGVTTVPFKPEIKMRMAIITSAERRISAISTDFIEQFRAHMIETAGRARSPGRTRIPRKTPRPRARPASRKA